MQLKHFWSSFTTCLTLTGTICFQRTWFAKWGRFLVAAWASMRKEMRNDDQTTSLWGRQGIPGTSHIAPSWVPRCCEGPGWHQLIATHLRASHICGTKPEEWLTAAKRKGKHRSTEVYLPPEQCLDDSWGSRSWTAPETCSRWWADSRAPRHCLSSCHCQQLEGSGRARGFLHTDEKNVGNFCGSL